MNHYINFSLPKSGPQDGQTASAYVPALLAFARRNNIVELPITLAMVEDAEAQDLKYTDHSYQRGHDVLADMIATIERRLPGDVSIRVTTEELVISVLVEEVRP